MTADRALMAHILDQLAQAPDDTDQAAVAEALGVPEQQIAATVDLLRMVPR